VTISVSTPAAFRRASMSVVGNTLTDVFFTTV